MTTEIVSSGQTKSFNISSGGIIVSSGGVLSNSTIYFNLSAFHSQTFGDVLSGGIATGTTVSGAAILTVENGGSAFATTVIGTFDNNNPRPASEEVVSFGGVASGTTLTGFSEQVVAGKASATIIDDLNSEQIVSSGGETFDTTISSGSQTVDFGGKSVDATVSNNARETVSAGGTARGTTVSSGGTVVLFGYLGGATVLSSGKIQVKSGGEFAGTVVSGGSVTVASGGQFDLTGAPPAGLTLASGAREAVIDGVTLSGLDVKKGLSLIVSSGGTVSKTEVMSGGTLELAGGKAVGVVLDVGASEALASGATLKGAIVSNARTLIVSSGATASGATVFAGGTVEVLGGATPDLKISSGGKEVLGGLYTVSGLAVGKGVTLTVTSGYLIRTIVSSGGLLIDSGGGRAPSVSGTIVSKGGNETVVDAISYRTQIKGGTQIVEGLGLTVSAVVSSGGRQQVAGGVLVSDTTVLSGGILAVSGGGYIDGGTVSSGGEIIFGAQTNSVHQLDVDVGAKEIITSGGFLDVVPGVTLRNLTVQDDATLIYAGGTVRDLKVDRGGTIEINATRIVKNLAITAGARLVVLVNGTAIAANIASGGALRDLGRTSNVVVGGTEQVEKAAIAFGSILRGGKEIVVNLGTASGTTISAGGLLTVQSGGAADATTISNGGIMAVSSGGTIGGTVKFGTHATLSFAPVSGTTLATSGFKATDAIDLTNFAFGSPVKHTFIENKAKTKGFLTVTDGRLKVTIDLFGQHVAAGFHFTKDGAGTAITYAAPTSAHSPDLAASHGI
jgi:autotransporter passenger strand-loop-strand repeat protein